MLNETQFKETHAKLASEGGFTVNHAGSPVISGYSVAPRGNEMRVPIKESGPQHLADYAAANADRLSRGASIGGWRSDTHDVFDTPRVMPDGVLGQSAGREAMVREGQEAMFHLNTFTEHFNPFHPDVRAAQGREPHEIADIAGRGPAGAEFALRQPEVQAYVGSPRNPARKPTSDSGRSPYSG